MIFKIQQNVANVAANIFAKFQKCQLDCLVDFEKILQNACSLAKIGADTAENERTSAEILPKLSTTLRLRDVAGVALADAEAPVLRRAEPLVRSGARVLARVAAQGKGGGCRS